MADSILKRWDITPEELTEVIDQNPSLRGMIPGYLAELKLEKLWLSGQGISNVTRHDDHDRKKKGDRVIRYKDHELIFESKSLQTATVKKADEGWVGKAQIDASDRREVVLPDGSTVTTTCLLKGEFDILAVNVFAFEDTWRFVLQRIPISPPRTTGGTRNINDDICWPRWSTFTGLPNRRFPKSRSR